MLARSRQLQSIFGFLKPFLHGQIWCQSVALLQNHGVWIKGASRDFTVLILTINAFQDPGFAGQGRGQLSAGGESQGGRGQDGLHGAAEPTVIFSSLLKLFDAYSDDRIL